MAPFGSVWLRFGSVSGPFRGVGWGRGEVGERGFCKGKEYHYTLGPAKTYILRGTPRTYAIKTRAVTDNSTIKKGPRKGNGGPVRGTDGPVKGTEGPVRGTEGPVTGTPLLVARNPF